MTLEQLTRRMEEIAREGGAFLRESRQSFQLSSVENKHEHDYVSYVDRDSERRLVARLHALLPQAGFITEEGTASAVSAGAGGNAPCASGSTAPVSGIDADRLEWVIDPLDGTTNFIRNNAPYCVCIALRSEREIVAGVVYEVCRDECYSAYKGGPALLNGSPIHVSATNLLTDAYAIMELPYNVEQYKCRGRLMYDQLYGQTACIRMPGSAAAAICYVAAGRFDLWFEQYIGLWDYMAASIVLRQAGGRVTTFKGDDNILHTDNIAASNGLLHSRLIEMIQKTEP
jgi:myo-inositol-1(or 4)-monophosphatase